MLIDLHWLPVRARIEYKIALFCFSSLKCSHTPIYLKNLLGVYQPARALRSRGSMLLEVPKTNLKTFGDRAFLNVGPAVWNSLPDDLRCVSSVDTFKSKLKTHLFRKHLLSDDLLC